MEDDRKYGRDYQERDEIETNVDASCIEIGTVFDHLENAAMVFNNYALKAGFNICKGNSKKDVY
jgi:hypothetical protein